MILTEKINIISDKLDSTAGSLRLGETVNLSYVDQSRETLDPIKTVWEEISEGNDVVEINSTFDEWKKDDPSSTFIGHNIIEFDESVLEYNLFSHMFYPYVTRKSRGDTLNLARGLYAINPSSIKTPLTERGNPSFKLEKLADNIEGAINTSFIIIIS